MKRYVIFGLLFLFDPSASAPNSRSSHDFDSLCSIRPTLSLCQWSEGALRIRRQLGGSGDEFCDSNKGQFGNNCNDRFSDNGQNDFCSSYGVRCRGWKKADQPRPQNVAPQQNPPPQNRPQQNNPVQQPKPQKPLRSGPPTANNMKYCQTYGSDYYKLCLRGSVPDFASTFCNSFKPNCPGVPDPGTLVGTPVNPPSSRLAPNSLPPPIPSNPLSPSAANPAVPSQPVPSAANPAVPSQPLPSAPQIPTSPQVPAGLPSNPSLPAGGLSSLPSSPNLPSGGLPSLPAGGQPQSPTGSLPQVPQQPQLGGQTPGGIGVGQAVNAPFFGGQSGANISPLSGVGTGTNLNAAGVGVGASQGVNFGGLPFLSSLNQAGGLGGLGGGGLGKKKRRRR